MKIGLIVEGGGMKCSYSAGILDRFIDENLQFDYSIGVSAGSANVASFLAGQKGRNKRFYTDYLDDPRYFGIHSYIETGNMFGLRYIYGDLTNSDGADPLDYDAIMKNKCEFKIVTTNALTGEATYFDKCDLIENNYIHIMASCALPVACKPILVNGIPFYDGGVSDSIPIEKAFLDGCDKVVVILSKPRNFVRKPQKFRLTYRTACINYPDIIYKIQKRHIMYKRQQKLVFEMEKEDKAFVFAPSNPPKMSTYSMNKDTEEELYELGKRDFDESKESLMEFLKKD